jgi:hypothetical protein
MDIDYYGDERWNSVKGINERLAALGPMLMSLDWQHAFSAHAVSSWPQFSLLNGTTSISGISAGTDPAAETYVEAGWLKNTNDHIVVVNRRTGAQEQRDITVHLSGTASCDIVNVETNCEYITAPNGAFTEHYLPGDGHIFRVGSAVWSGERTITCDVHVHEGATLTITPGSVVVIGAGHDLEINGTVVCEEDAMIDLDSGSIHFGPQGRLELGSGGTLRGSGALFHPNLFCTHGLNIDDDQYIDFFDGGSFAFSCDPNLQPQYVINSGSLIFHSSPVSYEFDDCLDEIRNWANGTFSTEGGTTLMNLPSVIGWDASQLTSDGTDDAVCTWAFRSGAMLEDYSTLYARHTWFIGSTAGGTTDAWDGILVGGEHSSIDAEFCTVRDIAVDTVYGGSGIHLYQSCSADNRIVQCDIERPDLGQNVCGDGVFLQMNSYLLLECTRINDRWFTAFTIVSGSAELFGNTFQNNGVGMSASGSAQVLMQRNCVTDHVWSGLSAGSGSTVRFYPVRTCEPGGNRIVDNGDWQVDISDAILYGGSVQPCGVTGGDNNISHAIPAMPRVRIDGGLATMQHNWWGVTPDLPNCEISSGLASVLFSVQNAVFLYNPALCFPTLVECMTGCEELSRTSMQSSQSQLLNTLAHQAASLDQLVAYADAGNFSEVYRYIDAAMPNSLPAEIAHARALLLASLEQRHALTYPDSLPLVRARLHAFLSARIQGAASMASKAAITNVLARALYALKDVQGTIAYVDSLQLKYPGSASADDILPTLQLAAMSMRDSVTMDRAIAMMQSARFSSEALRIARTMKRAYHRYRAACPMPKRRFVDEKPTDTNGTPLVLVRTFPNPFNPSISFEFTLPEADAVTLRIHSIAGMEVATVVHGPRPKGVNTAVFDVPESMPSGTYLYVLETSVGVVTGKIMLSR